MSVKIMGMVFEFYPVGGGEMLLALSLADFADDDGGRIFPSVSTLARKTRQSERSVQYQLRKMEQSGFIQVVERSRGGVVRGKKYRSNEYRINIGVLSNGAKTAPLNQRCNLAQSTVQSDASNGAIAVAPNPPLELSLEPPLPPLIFPSAVTPEEKTVIGGLMGALPENAKQELLDELAGAIRANAIRRGCVPFIRGLVDAYRRGQFSLSLGVAVVASRQMGRVADVQPLPFQVDEAAQAVGARIIANARNNVAKNPQVCGKT